MIGAILNVKLSKGFVGGYELDCTVNCNINQSPIDWPRKSIYRTRLVKARINSKRKGPSAPATTTQVEAIIPANYASITNYF